MGPTSNAAGNTSSACLALGCYVTASLDTGSSWVAFQSQTQILCSGGFGLACTLTGGGTTFYRQANPPIPISFCLHSAACLNDAYGNASEEESASNNDNIVFANEELGNAGADFQPQNASAEGTQEAGQPADKTPIDLYRSGNSTSPRLDNVRAGREFNTGPDGKEVLYPGQTPHPNGLSTFENQGVGKNWWKLPAGSPVPDGIQFFNDYSDHWTIEPLWSMGKDEYISIAEQTLGYWIGPLPAL
jgi:hypothetical protein